MVRAVAATVIATRSPPASAGTLQPKAASFAVHGVRRSICCADHAGEKLGCALRQLERAEQHAGRPQLQFRAAAVEHRDDAVGVRAGELSVDDLHALERQTGWRGAIRLDHEGARVLLDHLHGLARPERREQRNDRARRRIDPAREVRRDDLRSPLSDASVGGRMVHVVAPRQNAIRIGAAVEQEDHRLGRHALAAVERDTGGHPQRLAPLRVRERLCRRQASPAVPGPFAHFAARRRVAQGRPGAAPGPCRAARREPAARR